MNENIHRLTELRVADPSERWAALGFAVAPDATCELGGVLVRLSGPGEGITSWALHGIPKTDNIDGLPTTAAPPPQHHAPKHPNGATGIDHVVITTPDFDRTAEALKTAGLPLKRIGDAGTFRQGFRRIGPAILELVEAKTEPPDGPARFWGLVIVVADLEALKHRLQDHLGAIKPAVQPGRRIVTLRDTAGLTPQVAFMTPEPE